MGKYLGTSLSERDFEAVVKESARPNAKYRYTTGIALGRFLEELRNGRIIGTVCPPTAAGCTCRPGYTAATASAS